MEAKVKSLSPFRKTKLEGISLYLFLSEKGSDYLLLLSAKNELILFSLPTLTLLSRYEVHLACPLLLATDGLSNALLLDSAGLSTWTITQILEKTHPRKLKAVWPAPPLRLVPLGHDEHAVVCAGGKLLFLGEDGQREVAYSPEFLMEKAQHENLSTTEDCLFVLVPSAASRFPYLFTRSEVRQWESAGFLESYQQACSKHYLEDEVLPREESCMSLTARMRTVCVMTGRELWLLEWRGGPAGVAFVLSLRMRFKTAGSDSPLACHISSSTGEVVYAKPERAGVIHPLDYNTTKRTIKQRKEAVINWVYHCGSDLLMISHLGSNSPCRVYLVSIQEM